MRLNFAIQEGRSMLGKKSLPVLVTAGIEAIGGKEFINRPFGCLMY